MQSAKLAKLLLQKAEQDRYVMNRLVDDPSAPDEVIGFHAQQAAEKALKAWLVLLDVDYPLTHSLFTLLNLLREAGADCARYETLEGLTPYAVELRYGTAVTGAQVDPAAVAPMIVELVAHVRELLEAAETEAQ